MRIDNISCLLLCTIPSGTAFIKSPNHHLFPRSNIEERLRPLASAASDNELFDAENDAAWDAHDLSDSAVEAASMERAVMMADELNNKPIKVTPKRDNAKTKSIFRHGLDESEEEFEEAEEEVIHDAEGLSDSAMEAAALERALMMAEEFREAHSYQDEKKTNPKETVVGKVKSFFRHGLDESDEEFEEAEEEVIYDSSGLSDAGMEAAMMERALMMAEEYREAHAHKKDTVKSVEEHYESMDQDVKDIENLIKKAAKADGSESHSMERIFSDNDAADLALLMIEKSVSAAADKLEICQTEAEQAQREIREALEAKYAAKAIAETIERERHAAEMQMLSTEHFDDEADTMERLRDASVVHANEKLLEDALKQEHDAELRLENAIERDIKAKREFEQMIDNKAILKEEMHELEKIIHEHAVMVWEKEKARKLKENHQ